MLFGEGSAKLADEIESVLAILGKVFLGPEFLTALPFIIGFSILIPGGMGILLYFESKDRPNWSEVARDDRYVYEQHKTKRKRRVRMIHPVKTLEEGRVKAWLKYRTETL